MLLPDTIIMTPVPLCEDATMGVCLTAADDYRGHTALWLTINGYPDTMTPVTVCTPRTRDQVCLAPVSTDDTTTWWLITPSMVKDINLGA